MKVGDLVTFKEPDFQESYGAGVILEKYHSSIDYGYVVWFREEKIHVREEELKIINESR